MNFHRIKQFKKLVLSAFLCSGLIMTAGHNAYAAPSAAEDYLALAEERKSLPIQSNQIENWPAGPAIGAESAILLEANTGVILYAKNIDEKLYPASTTKLMTCLVAAENSRLDDTVTFSHNAVFSIDKGSSNIGIDEGQSMPMEECLYGILTASANEVANGVAEHIAGSTDAFTELMNQKAEELGCTNTHFVNAHGLYDQNHYTTAYDLALIAKAFFQNELLSKIGNTASHHFVATATQPDDFIVRNKHQLITGEIPYEGIKGGKTGYTDEARQTLVTCAEQDGMKLICVIMKEESPEQFYDTVKLFDYGFTNFSVVNVSENEAKYAIQNSNFFHTSSDVFGDSSPILSINKNSYLIMPGTTSFKELASEISYDTDDAHEVANICYYYHGAYLGTATIDLVQKAPVSYEFSTESEATGNKRIVVINVKLILLIILAIAIFLITVFVIFSFVNSYNIIDHKTTGKKRSITGRRRKRNRKDGPHFPSSRFNGFDL